MEIKYRDQTIICDGDIYKWRDEVSVHNQGIKEKIDRVLNRPLKDLQEIESELDNTTINSEQKAYIIERINSIENVLTKPQMNYESKWAELKSKIVMMVKTIDGTSNEMHRDVDRYRKVTQNSDAKSIKRLQLEYLLTLMEEMESEDE